MLYLGAFFILSTNRLQYGSLCYISHLYETGCTLYYTAEHWAHCSFVSHHHITHIHIHPVLHRYITVYLPSGSCHSDVTSIPPPLPLPLISRLDARTSSAVPNCLAARTRCAAHFFSFLRSCGDVTFLCVGPRMNEILDVITSKCYSLHNWRVT